MDRVVVCKGKGGSEGGRIGKGTCMMTSMWGKECPWRRVDAHRPRALVRTLHYCNQINRDAAQHKTP
jgi:hypothetical protein